MFVKIDSQSSRMPTDNFLRRGEYNLDLQNLSRGQIAKYDADRMKIEDAREKYCTTCRANVCNTGSGCMKTENLLPVCSQI